MKVLSMLNFSNVQIITQENNLGMNVSEFEAFVAKYPEYEGLFEYVRGSRRMGEHYRFIPETRWNPTQAQLFARLEFMLASFHAYGSTGFDELDGEILPVVAVAVAERMRGKKYTTKKPLIESASFWSKLRTRFRGRMFQEPEKLRTKKLKRIAYSMEELRPQSKSSILPKQIKTEEKEKTLMYAQVEYYAKQLHEINMRVLDDIFAGREPKTRLVYSRKRRRFEVV
jgi:hypothetical protein